MAVDGCGPPNPIGFVTGLRPSSTTGPHRFRDGTPSLLNHRGRPSSTTADVSPQPPDRTGFVTGLRPSSTTADVSPQPPDRTGFVTGLRPSSTTADVHPHP